MSVWFTPFLVGMAVTYGFPGLVMLLERCLVLANPQRARRGTPPSPPVRLDGRVMIQGLRIGTGFLVVMTPLTLSSAPRGPDHRRGTSRTAGSASLCGANVSPTMPLARLSEAERSSNALLTLRRCRAGSPRMCFSLPIGRARRTRDESHA